MATWYQKLFGRTPSKDVAKERLKLVLLHDRADLSPTLLNQLQDELIEVVSQVFSKYFVIDSDSVDVKITRVEAEETGNVGATSALVANIPIRSVKDGNLR